MITSEQEKQYVANKGLRCPHCDSDDLDAGEPKMDGDIIIPVSCKNCNEEWEELYKLAGIIQD